VDARYHPKKTARELQIDWRSSKATTMSTVIEIVYNLFIHIKARVEIQ